MMRLFLLLFLSTGCSSMMNVERSNMDNIEHSSGVTQYILSDLPSWANFSSMGQCARKENIRYLNFSNLSRSYNLNYEQMLQLQLNFNRKISQALSNAESGQSLLIDDTFYFYNSYEQILGGGRDFIVPSFKKINLIWIDPIFNNKDFFNRFKALMSSKKIEGGHPVFISSCQSAQELDQFITKNNYNSMGVRGLSQELFSPYDSEGNFINLFLIDISRLMPNKEITLYAPWHPKEIQGEIKFVVY